MKSPLLRVLLLAVLLWPVRSLAQSGPALPMRDVVILALGSDDSSEEGVLRAAMKLAGQSVDRNTLRDIQMDIVRKTAPFGPVLLLAPDDEVRSAITSNCSALEICDYLSDGRVRVAVVPHDTEWIRDYGPFIEALANDVRVVDSAYHDVREDDRINYTLQALLERRLELLKHALGASTGDDDDTFDVEMAGVNGAEVESRISLLKQFSDALRESASYAQRPTDDRSPFSIAQAVLAQPSFSLASTKLFIDGGNLLKLEDGVCLTSKDLHSRNPERHNDLVIELKKTYACSDVVFLESLPGPVIEHVDMFVLPVRDKKLLLPNFALDQGHITSAWKNMNEVERELTLQAALAIERNVATLRGKGYDVTLIPALTPRASSNGRVYYPTMLNALVRSNGVDSLQVLVPAYSGLQEDVQKEALEKIQAAFGPYAQVLKIEATVAARGQGAIHCLTITAPYSLSVFRGGSDLTLRKMTELRKKLDAANQLLTTPHLIGAWSTSRAGEVKPKNNSIAITASFSEDGKIRLTFAGRPMAGTYKVIEDPNMKWPLEIEIAPSDSPRKSPQDTRKIVGRVEWVTDRLFRLVLSDGDALLMRKVLSLAELETGAREVVVGSSRKGILRDSDERDGDGSLVQAWALSGKAGEAVVLDVTSDTFDTVVSVVGPGLSRPLYDDDSGDNLNASLVVEFPQTGIYKVIVQAADSREAGEFTIKATPRAPVHTLGDWDDQSVVTYFKTMPVQPQKLEVDRQQNAELTATTSKAPNGHPVQAWILDRCDGGRVRVSAKSEDFDTVLFVLGSRPDDQLLMNDDDEAEPLLSDSAVEFECARASAYRVVVTSFGHDERGKFSLEVKPAAK